MPRPRSLTSGQIATAALAVIDREGLAALSMRAVASRLGTGTMSLYRYVSDRSQLERLVVDVVLAELDPLVPRELPWAERIALLAGRVRAAVLAHPAVVPLLMSHRHLVPAIHRVGESILAALTDAGLTGTDRVVAFRAVLAYLMGALQAAGLGPLPGAGTAVLAALPADEFPYLAATASAAQRVTPDDEFAGGLDLLLRGLVPPPN